TGNQPPLLLRAVERPGTAQQHPSGEEHQEGQDHAPPLAAAGRVRSQLASSRPPASPDFSGWNWGAVSAPCSTAAPKRSPPCSAHVTSGGAMEPIGSIRQLRAA